MEPNTVLKEGVSFNKEGYLIFSSGNLEDCVKVYKKYKCNKALFSKFGVLPTGGYTLEHLDLLNEINVEYLIILSTDIKDISSISNQRSLRELRIESDAQSYPVDFAGFPKLEEFRGYWHKQLTHLFECLTLKKLTLWKYKPKEADLTKMSGLSKLESLSIFQSNITSAVGTGELKNLKHLGLAYNPKLISFTAPSSNKYFLEELEIEACQNMDLQTLPSLPSLKIFNLLNHGKLESLEQTLEKMNSLEEINFSETTLLNGDNSYFLRHKKLNEVYFLDKKHYKFTCDEINEGLQDPGKKKILLARK